MKIVGKEFFRHVFPQPMDVMFMESSRGIAIGDAVRIAHYHKQG